ncbi:MAG: hypothetical protein ACRD2J_00210 [Thermoanaerobaculia bacterium]
MRFRLVFLLVSLLAVSCASTPTVEADPRLAVAATLSNDVGANFLYTVLITNLAGDVLTIRRVEVEPVGGGRTLPASDAPLKRLEPGETMDVPVWVEIAPGETVLGVGKLARIIVSFEDPPETVMSTYLVELE